MLELVPGDAGRPRVLVVEDDPIQRLLYERLLASAQLDVILAADGHEGLSHAIDHRPDLVLADVEMPGLDGLGLTTALRSDARTSDVPVVIVTGSGDPGTRERAFAAGAHAFLTKPFDIPLLLATVLELARRPPEPEGGAAA